MREIKFIATKTRDLAKWIAMLPFQLKQLSNLKVRLAIYLICLVFLAPYVSSTIPVEKKLSGKVSDLLVVKGPVNNAMAVKFISQLKGQVKGGSKRVTLLVNSPGGSVDAGNEMIDAMREAQEKGTHLTCLTQIAISMAMYIIANCDLVLGEGRTKMLWHPTSLSGFIRSRVDHLNDDIDKRIAIEEKLDAFLLDKLGVSKDQFDAYRQAEYLHPFDNIIRIAPDFAKKADNLVINLTLKEYTITYEDHEYVHETIMRDWEARLAPYLSGP